MSDLSEVMIVLLIAISAVGLGIQIGTANEAGRFEREAIERGYAHHCPDTGELAWKGECDG